MFQLQLFCLLHCDEWDRVVALPIHKFVTGATLLQLLWHLSRIKVITKLPNSEQSYKGKVKNHNYINRQNQSTTEKL
jgi:predicted ferric reductase